MMEFPKKKVLVVAPAWVGDMVMSQVLYKLLYRKNREIDVLAPAATLPLVARMPEISIGIQIKQGHGDLGLAYRRGLGQKLAEREYDQAIVLPNSFKSALVPWFADIPDRTGFRGEYRYVVINDMRMMDARRLPRMVDRFIALGVDVNVPLPEIEFPRLTVDEDNLRDKMNVLGLREGRRVLGLCPGAEFGDAKKWPEEHYARLAAHAISRGMDVWIMGGPGDIDTGARISELARDATGSGALADLTGKTQLLDAVDLLSACSLVVSNDSGLMHVAAAVDVPVVVLYGSTSPGFTPPLSEKAMILSENLDCSPCFERTCPLGHKNCLNNLLPARVEAIVDQYAGEIA